MSNKLLDDAMRLKDNLTETAQDVNSALHGGSASTGSQTSGSHASGGLGSMISGALSGGTGEQLKNAALNKVKDLIGK